MPAYRVAYSLVDDCVFSILRQDSGAVVRSLIQIPELMRVQLQAVAQFKRFQLEQARGELGFVGEAAGI
jgi:hypothetical protein